MKRKRLAITLIALLALLLTTNGATGQGPDSEGEAHPRGDVSIASSVNSRISYQGRLLEDDAPVTGSRDMTFRLYSEDTCATQVGSDIVKNGVTVTDALFSVELDVSHWDFDGQGLWLEVEADGTAIGCQEVLPVPYALSLRPGAIIDDAASRLYLNWYRASPAPFFDTHKYGLHAVADGNYDFAYGVSGVAHSPRLGGEAYGLYGSATATGTSGTAYGVYGITDSNDPLSAGVYGDGATQGVRGTGITYGVYGETSIGVAGVRGYHDGSGTGVWGIAGATSGTTYGVRGTSSSSTEDSCGVFGKSIATSGETYGVRGESDSTTAGSAGVFGKATAVSGQVFGVVGETDSSTVGAMGVKGNALATSGHTFGVFGRSASNWGYGVYGLASADSGENTGGYFVAYGDQGHGVYAKAEGTYGTGIVAQGGPSGHAADFHGNVQILSRDTGEIVIELGEGLDYAEGFDVSAETEIVPGTVLVIDPDNPGRLTASDTAYDRKVAGIVSGALGMGSAVRVGPDQFDYDVALAGRVYCYVDATEAGVEPGDLLTTSATPGYAMKVTDYVRAQGAILGKAMQRLEKGQKGLILVLVTLQ